MKLTTVAFVAGAVAACMGGSEGANIDVSKFILKDVSGNDTECQLFVSNLVSDFTASVTHTVNCKLGDKEACGKASETALLELDSPADNLADIFSNALGYGDGDADSSADDSSADDSSADDSSAKDSPSNVAKKDTLSIENEVEMPKHMKESLERMNERDAEHIGAYVEDKVVAIPEEKSEKLLEQRKEAAGAMKSATKKMDLLPEKARRTAKKAFAQINEILADLTNDCKRVEVVDGMCKVNINAKSLKAGIEDLFSKIDECMQLPDEPCDLTPPFSSEVEETPTSSFVELASSMHMRALSHAQQSALLEQTLSGKDRKALVEEAFQHGSKLNAVLQHKNPNYKLYRADCMDMITKAEQDFNMTNEDALHAEIMKCLELKIRNGTREEIDSGAEAIERARHCNASKTNDAELMYCPESDAKLVETCFATRIEQEKNGVQETKSGKFVWNVSNANTSIANGMCGRPRFFEVNKESVNGASVPLARLIHDSSLRAKVINGLKTKVVVLKAVSDACGHDAQTAASVKMMGTDTGNPSLFVEIDCAKVDGGCNKYMCDQEKHAKLFPVSEVHIGYRFTDQCNWNIFAVARVQGTSLSIREPDCEDDKKEVVKERRRRRLLTTGSRGSGLGC